MTVRELVSVGLRFFALWLLLAAFKTFEMLTSVERFMRMQAEAQGIGSLVRSTGLVIAILISTALLLWIACRPIALALTKGAVSPQSIRLTSDGIVTAGCVLLGLWGAKESLIPLIEIWVTGLLNSHLSDQSLFDTLSAHDKINAASHLAEFIVSLILLLRPYQISALLLRNGNSGQPSSPEQPTSSDAT